MRILRSTRSADLTTSEWSAGTPPSCCDGQKPIAARSARNSSCERGSMVDDAYLRSRRVAAATSFPAMALPVEIRTSCPTLAAMSPGIPVIAAHVSPIAEATAHKRWLSLRPNPAAASRRRFALDLGPSSSRTPSAIEDRARAATLSQSSASAGSRSPTSNSTLTSAAALVSLAKTLLEVRWRHSQR